MLLNSLLPFTKPGTPLTQDLIHTAILCGTLYFAPQIAERYNAQQRRSQPTDTPAHSTERTQVENDTTAPEGAPLDEGLARRHADHDHDHDNNAAPTPPNQPNHQPNIEDDDHAPGPANPNPNHPRPTPANRTIGAKKAKSLARKDQRRAYHEFHRQEAELRRLQESEGAEEREASLQAERTRRVAIEEAIREKEREERERLKREREIEAAEEVERRERVVKFVGEEVRRRGGVDLVDVAYTEGKDRLWAERLVRASGLMAALQREGDGHVMITARGWLVRIDVELMEQVYKDAEVLGNGKEGKVSFEQFGGVLERAVLARAKA